MAFIGSNKYLIAATMFMEKQTNTVLKIESTINSEELYRFGADGNLRLYSYDSLFYSLYGYDGGTTRTYNKILCKNGITNNL